MIYESEQIQSVTTACQNLLTFREPSEKRNVKNSGINQINPLYLSRNFQNV